MGPISTYTSRAKFLPDLQQQQQQQQQQQPSTWGLQKEILYWERGKLPSGI